ncbi:hypothetical protein BZG36_00202 [Bifiguratus adelaidae]|uniref:Uncharacterized protein n=1 Tax=Bifiguratus adelaidae TaxID=1938954 RepID=A0A261Y8Q5_9FUNG|nr:hypothetical protein BZG36_00202 [Bifiguratus adelaidae]
MCAVLLVEGLPMYKFSLQSLGSYEHEPLLLPDPMPTGKVIVSNTKATRHPIEISDDHSKAPLTKEEQMEAFDNATTNMDRKRGRLAHLDVPQFAQYMVSHLYFDHFDGLVSELSTSTARSCIDLIQLNVDDLDKWDDCMSVDADILTGQLKGGIEAFIEDRLPEVWNRRAKALDKQTLAVFIRDAMNNLCPRQFAYPMPAETVETIALACFETATPHFLQKINDYIDTHLRAAVSDMERIEIPQLLAQAHQQISQTIDYFNTHVPQESHPSHPHRLLQLQPLLGTFHIPDAVKQKLARKATPSIEGTDRILSFAHMALHDVL